MRLFEGTEFDIPPRCEKCGELEEECNCPPPEPERVPPNKQLLRVQAERRKKGKTVTVIRDLQELAKHRSELLTALKNAVGAGGTVKDETIEIQGDHVVRVREHLEQAGYRVRK